MGITSAEHRLKCIKVLLEKGAEIEEKNTDGMTALDFAKEGPIVSHKRGFGKVIKAAKKIEKMFDRKRKENAASIRAIEKREKKEAKKLDKRKQNLKRKANSKSQKKTLYLKDILNLKKKTS